jgi:hypothetical protein
MPLANRSCFGHKNTILIAIACGVICGFVEGLVLFLHLNPNLAAWNTADVLWLAILADLLWFVLVVYPIVLFRVFIKTLPGRRPVIALLAALFSFNWLSLPFSGRVQTYSLVILAVGIGVALSRWRVWEQVNPARLRNGLLWTAAAATLSIAVIHAVSATRGGVESSIETPVLTPAGSRPNVLLIVVDTLRADHLSVYGYTRSTSPNLDRLAREGVLFENAIAPSSWSLPSHTSMLSGRFPNEHRADEVHGTFDGRYLLISEHMQRIGYRTAAFSGNSMYFSPLVGLGKGFERFDFHSDAVTEKAGRTLYVQKFFAGLRKFGLASYQPGRWQASDMAHTALEWIDQDRQRPFFAARNRFSATSTVMTAPSPMWMRK